ncbi:SPARC-like protein 1 [Astatotilapia calliptera]|uniref:SPARC-like protein 1 n=1 Tax=Astatotilapia calliptera TaxID=8154 RepID=UPI000E411E8E|nr:SPARC-like protein 1 [Astatotilapia calliptera]XP_026045094.1 SPARC-like protein 1 [Astatotilapia calliptera]
MRKRLRERRRQNKETKENANKGITTEGRSDRGPAPLGGSTMKLNIICSLFLLLGVQTVKGGRAQRKQRQAEESLRPYIGRVKPEKLCELLKCRTPVGSWCQVVQENGILIPKCVCPQSCPRQRAPVCSVVGKTYENECWLHKDACRKRRRTGLAHTGPCLVPKGKCTEEELGQFPYRLLDWFLLLSRMGESYAPAAPPQSCLSHTQRTQLAQKRFTLLDRNKDGKLSRRDLKKLHYKRMPLEHCATPFFQSCDRNRNRKVTLNEWTACLVDRSEAWFYQLMSMRMGSLKLCPTIKRNYL